LYGLALGILLYAGAMIWLELSSEGDPVRASLAGYPWWVLAVALGLSSVNYLLRFAKWELALGWLRVREDAPRLGVTRSLVIYLAGLSMSVTPGKLGEVLRSALLKASDGVPVTRTAPIVLADRITDLVALVVLSLLGISQFQAALPVVAVTAALVIAGVAVLGSPRLLRPVLRAAGRLPRLQGIAQRLEPLVDSTAVVLRLRGLVALSLLSIVGWGLECVGFWLLLGAFPGVDASLATCTLLWSVCTLVGALSFLPGGLGATEGSLVVATLRLVPSASQPVAVAAALLGRITTLWWGELVGGVALAVFLRDASVRGRAMSDELG
jgi:uncharacterized membrane protein YbhN (UPF0104 family)